MQGLKNFTTHVYFPRKLQKNVLHKDKSVNQENGGHRIQETEAPTQERCKGSPQDVGEGQ